MIYHVVSQAAWEAEPHQPYRHPSLESEGFIHFSFAQQVRLSRQRYALGLDPLVIVEVAEAGLDVRIENGFPHLYEPLPRESVRSIQSLPVYRDIRVALLARTFPDPAELRGALQECRSQGADLVMLPELPFHSWFPARRAPHEVASTPWEEAAQAAREAGLGLLGGGLHQGCNQARLWDRQGYERLRYEKLHLPQEPGFWEADHYAPGHALPRVCDHLGFPLGIQLCSDAMRPFGAFALRAQGAGAILHPRATERATYPRWRRVLQALAQTTSCYLLSVNRQEPDLGLGGPSVAVGPDGEILAEGEQSILLCDLKHEEIVRTRADYPGYLEVPLELYARGWSELAAGQGFFASEPPHS